MIDNLRNTGAPFSKVWIDVEGPVGTYWTSSTATNQQFLINMIGALKGKVSRASRTRAVVDRQMRRALSERLGVIKN